MTGLLDSESLPTGMPQLLDTLRWLKIMQLHTTCARSYAGKQTCIPVHATHTHAHSYGASIFSHAARGAWKRKAASSEKHFTSLWEWVTGLSYHTLGPCHVHTQTNTHRRNRRIKNKKTPQKLLKSNNKGYLSQNYFSSYLKLAFFFTTILKL